MTDLNALFSDEKTREIVREVLAKNGSAGDGNQTNYGLLDHDGKVIVERKRAACYAGLPGDAHSNNKKIRYVTSLQRPRTLEAGPCIRWIQLCQKSGAIGDTQQFAEDIFYRGLKIDLMNPYWSADKLYITLCNYRFIREAPQMVENIIKLVDEADIPFWHAFVFCHGHNFTAFGHSWLGWGSSPYSTGTGVGREKNNLWFVRFLSDYLGKNIGKSLTPHWYTTLQKQKAGWSISRVMLAKNNLPLNDRTKMLTNKAIEICGSASFKVAKEKFKEL